MSYEDTEFCRKVMLMLSPKQASILTLWSTGHTLKEIGMFLRLSRERVRQIHKQTIREIQRNLQLDCFQFPQTNKTKEPPWTNWFRNDSESPLEVLRTWLPERWEGRQKKQEWIRLCTEVNARIAARNSPPTTQSSKPVHRKYIDEETRRKRRAARAEKIRAQLEYHPSRWSPKERNACMQQLRIIEKGL